MPFIMAQNGTGDSDQRRSLAADGAIAMAFGPLTAKTLLAV
jgi:hypothetical protein